LTRSGDSIGGAAPITICVISISSLDVTDLSGVAYCGRTRGAMWASIRHTWRHERPATARLCLSGGGQGRLAARESQPARLCRAARMPRLLYARRRATAGGRRRGVNDFVIIPPFSCSFFDSTTLHDTVTGVRLDGPRFVPLLLGGLIARPLSFFLEICPAFSQR